MTITEPKQNVAEDSCEGSTNVFVMKWISVEVLTTFSIFLALAAHGELGDPRSYSTQRRL